MIKINDFEFLFQKAGKRTLFVTDTYRGGRSKVYVNMPNIIYCYKKGVVPRSSTLLVFATDADSITDTSPLYRISLTNTTYKRISGNIFSTVCMSECWNTLNDVQDAAAYFLSSSFSDAPPTFSKTIYQIRSIIKPVDLHLVICASF